MYRLLSNKICIIFCIIIFTGASWAYCKDAFSDDSRFFIIDNIDFGKLLTSSEGGQIVLSEDELKEPAESRKGLMRISGAKVGKIRYVPATDDEYICHIQYPDEYWLDEEKKLRLRYMSSYSTTEVTREEDRTYYDITMGAELTVYRGFVGNVKGSIPVTIYLCKDNK